MSQVRRLLAAAATFGSPFAENDLAVRAWEKFPGDFALAGHPSHCDIYKVRWLLTCGDRGLLQRGYFARVNGKLVLTQLGRDTTVDGSPLTSANAPHTRVSLVLAFLSTKLYRRWRERSYSFVSSADVAEALSSNVTGYPPWRRLKSFRAALCELRKRAKGGAVVARDGSTVSIEQMDYVDMCLDWCQHRFAKLFERKKS